jgi:chemotaxis methyl-accepting protein methylase
VKVRAVRVRPDVVALIDTRDLNVVLERAEPAGGDGLFDLVVATNVLAYYGTFEQALAVTNIARMLRPGGSLLSNQAVLPVPPMKPEVGDHTVVYSNRQLDHVFWYQRQ